MLCPFLNRLNCTSVELPESRCEALASRLTFDLPLAPLFVLYLETFLMKTLF